MNLNVTIAIAILVIGVPAVVYKHRRDSKKISERHQQELAAIDERYGQRKALFFLQAYQTFLQTNAELAEVEPDVAPDFLRQIHNTYLQMLVSDDGIDKEALKWLDKAFDYTAVMSPDVAARMRKAITEGVYEKA